jgi:2-dehydro-3-deoxyphosphogluconate aldolase / (4S)-4-hydroxy-2-oxoglutarate aldolase
MPALSETALQRLQSEQLLAVVRAPCAGAAVRTARALAAGGRRGLEVTYSTPDAPAAIAELVDDDELFVGAGTVLTADEAEQAIQAGAEFLVSPSLSMPVIERGRAASVLTIPGAITPTELAAASEHAEVVKLFPASLGGPGYLRAVLAPFPDLKLVPTGGVSAENLGEWYAAGAFALGAGGDLCSNTMIAGGDYDGVTANARRYRTALDELEGL